MLWVQMANGRDNITNVPASHHCKPPPVSNPLLFRKVCYKTPPPLLKENVKFNLFLRAHHISFGALMNIILCVCTMLVCVSSGSPNKHSLGIIISVISHCENCRN